MRVQLWGKLAPILLIFSDFFFESSMNIQPRIISIFLFLTKFLKKYHLSYIFMMSSSSLILTNHIHEIQS